MKKIIIFSLFIIAMSWCGCRDDCTDCEGYTRTLALYIKIQGTAKDSILNIEGNIYNEITGTRTVFATVRQDSIYSANIQIFEDLTRCECELDVFLEGDEKRVLIDLTGKVDFLNSRIQVISVDVSFGLLGLEVYLNDYQPNKEIKNDDLEPK